MATTQERLDAIRTALAAHGAAGGVVKVREVDGREVQYDYALLIQEEVRLQRQLEAECGNLTGGLLQRTRYRRMR